MHVKELGFIDFDPIQSSSGSPVQSSSLLKVFPSTVVVQDRGSYGIVHVLLFNFKQSLPLTVGVSHRISDLHDET